MQKVATKKALLLSREKVRQNDLENEFLNLGFEVSFEDCFDGAFKLALNQEFDVIVADYELLGNEKDAFALVKNLQNTFLVVKFFVFINSEDEKWELSRLGIQETFDKKDSSAIYRLLKKIK